MNLEPIFSAAYRQLRPRSPIPEIHISFFPFAGLNHTIRRLNGRLIVRLSDVFTDAPAEVYRCLALILLAKLYRTKIDRSYHRVYRTFVLSRDIQERARLIRTHRSRSRRPVQSRGRYVDLSASFERLNMQYFGGGLKTPAISWTPKKSRHVLGRYDATHNTIFISRIFDAPDIPPYVIDYVMFHEMLHLKHECLVHQSRMIVHTAEFKADESRFEYYREAKCWLNSVW